MLDWNDIRHFLAVADCGSTVAAAKVLKVSQPTVVRRIAAMERALDTILFDRSPSGYTLTPAGEAILAPCRSVADATRSVEEASQSQAREITGTVRISVFEIYATTLLTPLINELRTAYPHIKVELDLSQQVRDIVAGEADIAVRSGVRLQGSGLVCRKLIEERWGYFCSRGYAETHGIPQSPKEAASHVIIGDGSEDFWLEFEAWRRESGLVATVDLHHGGPTAMLAAVRSGLGIGLLPHLTAWQDPDLLLCFDGPQTDHRLWLVTSERLRRAPRIRAVMDFLAHRINNSASSNKTGADTSDQ